MNSFGAAAPPAALPVLAAAALVAGAALPPLGTAGTTAVHGAEEQQAADPGFEYANEDPAFPPGGGPRVCIDAAHNNYHTADGRYRPFAELLRGDGYVVESFDEVFTRDSLESCALLVIANPLGEANAGDDWAFPHPSAFSREELNGLYTWISEGGSLLLIADHAPIAGAARDLGTILGVGMLDGYAYDPESEPDTFRSDDGTLADHPITRGRTSAEGIDTVVTFTGQAFVAGEGIEPLLIWGSGAISAISLEDNLPDLPREDYPVIRVEGWMHGAASELGGGRFVVLGEAAMCTEQANEDFQFGMNHPEARQNAQFCLNVVRWLTGVLE